jgi:unsaturated rhamnogalacturonyl hydrolase
MKRNKTTEKESAHKMLTNASCKSHSGDKKKAHVPGTLVTVIAMLLFTAAMPCHAQKKIPSEFLPAVGDAPDGAPPLATDLSPDLERATVEKAIIKVADWQLERSRKDFNRDWTFAALYTGFMAASASTGNAKYSDAMMAMGKKFKWELATESKNADDDGVGRTYIELYLKYRDPEMIAATRKKFDELIRGPEKPPQVQFPWWWCDALFMGPPAWAGMYKATGDIGYLDYMNREWWATSGRLYDHQEHLYFRDASFLNRKQANGRKLFWSRGNGWVMAGLAGVLEYMPENYPDRYLFVQQFREMSAAIAKIQGSDGLWRTGLLDAESYPLPENSGSAFFTYALAWGINRGILERAVYEPVVAKAWKGLLQHIYEDGRFGCIQAVSDAPGKFKPTSSYVYGVGAFLLAGSEVDRLAQSKN